MRKLASPFGHPTQVFTQVQLAPTCDYLLVRLARAQDALAIGSTDYPPLFGKGVREEGTEIEPTFATGIMVLLYSWLGDKYNYHASSQAFLIKRTGHHCAIHCLSMTHVLNQITVMYQGTFCSLWFQSQLAIFQAVSLFRVILYPYSDTVERLVFQNTKSLQVKSIYFEPLASNHLS